MSLTWFCKITFVLSANRIKEWLVLNLLNMLELLLVIIIGIFQLLKLGTAISCKYISQYLLTYRTS